MTYVWCSPAWIVTALAGMHSPVTPSTPAAEAAPPAVRSEPRQTELTDAEVSAVIRLRGGLPAVEVSFDEERRFHLVVDIGAAATSLDDEVVEALGLETVRTLGPDEGGARAAEASVKVVRVPAMEVGKAKFLDFEAVVTDYDALAGGRRQYDGVLALPTLTETLVRLDFPALRLTLSSGTLGEPDGKEILSAGRADGQFTAPITLEEATLDAVIRTGGTEALILQESWKERTTVVPRLGGLAGRRDLISDIDVDQQMVSGKGRVGRFAFVNPPVDFRDGPAAVGFELLRHFTLTVDTRNLRLGLSRENTDPITFPLRSRFGLILARKGIWLAIVHVIPDTPAARFRLTDADLVKVFNKEHPSDLTDAEIRERLRHAETLDLRIERSGFMMDLPLKHTD